MPKVVQKKINNLNRIKYGIWGTLGSGNNCEVHFIQTILTSDDIDNVKRISEIPESQKWKVKDLFQRNVNKKRVNDGIIPYLNDDTRIKFFNPLTLIILPHDLKDRIIKEIPILKQEKYVDSNTELEFDGFNYEGFYRFGLSDEPFFGKVDWNSNTCYMVAIDGQHRLTALKEIKNNPNNNISDWKVPAVILMVHKTKNVNTPDLLEVVRKVFIDINNRARKVNNARKIILNDALSVDVLCQEIIEYSHSQKNESLPLHFFDWRGDDDDQIPVSSLVSVEELNNWFTNYFGFSDDNTTEFKLPEWLIRIGLPKGDLSSNSSKLLRDTLMKDFVPAFHKYFNNLSYVKNYFDKISNTLTGLDLSYFLEREKYGEPTKIELQEEYNYQNKSKIKIRSIKETCIPSLLQKEIGIRSIIYCYSQFEIFKEIYKIKTKKDNYTWLLHADFCSQIVNKVINDKWFDSSVSAAQKNCLLNLVYSSSDITINYRIVDSEKALGSLVMLICIIKSGVNVSKDPISTIIDNYFENLSDTYKKDIRKEVRSNLLPTFRGTQKELVEKVKKETELKTKKKIDFVKKIFNDYDLEMKKK